MRTAGGEKANVFTLGGDKIKQSPVKTSAVARAPTELAESIAKRQRTELLTADSQGEDSSEPGESNMLPPAAQDSRRQAVNPDPAWEAISTKLLTELSNNGFISNTDSPQVVFTDLSIEDVEQVMQLTHLERQELFAAGCRSEAQLQMPPPPSRPVPPDMAYEAALQGVRESITGAERDRLFRILASTLDIQNAKTPTFNAMAAVLSQLAWPHKYARDKDAWVAHGAKESNYRTWKKKILAVALQSAQDATAREAIEDLDDVESQDAAGYSICEESVQLAQNDLTRPIRGFNLNGMGASYVQCTDGWVLIAGDHDESVSPLCTKSSCRQEALAWVQREGLIMLAQEEAGTALPAQEAQLAGQHEGGLELLHGACLRASPLDELPMQQPGCSESSDGAHRWLSCGACLRLTEAAHDPGHIQCRLCSITRPFAGALCSCIAPAAPALAATLSVPLKDQPAPQPTPTLKKLTSPPKEASKKNVRWLKGLVNPSKWHKPNFLSRISSGESKQELLTQSGSAFTIADDEPHAARIGYVHHLTAPWAAIENQQHLRSLAFGVALLERMVEQAEACMAVAIGPAFKMEELLLGFHTRPSIPHLHLHAIYPMGKVQAASRWRAPLLITPQSWRALSTPEQINPPSSEAGYCTSDTHKLLRCNACGNLVKALPNVNVCHCMKIGCWRTVAVGGDSEFCVCEKPPQRTPAAEAPSEADRSESLQAANAGQAELRDKLYATLTARLGFPTADAPSKNALMAVLSQRLWPDRYETDEDAWSLHLASAQDFQIWKEAISDLEAASPSAKSELDDPLRSRQAKVELGIAHRVQAWREYDERIKIKKAGAARRRRWKQEQRHGKADWAALQATLEVIEAPRNDELFRPENAATPVIGEATSRGIWRPSLTSVQRRRASDERNAKARELRNQSTAPPADLKTPKRYSASSSLAPGLGVDLLRQRQAMNLGAPNVAPSTTPSIHPDDNLPPRELPLTLFEREFRLAFLGNDFKWPEATHVAFYDDHGHIRESWGALGYISISIADRPTRIPPGKNCFHFIGQVYDFVQAFPHPIVVGTSHVECGPSTWSSYKTWPEKILDGSMRESGEELLWITCIGDRHAAEQPYCAHEHTIGPPTQVINLNLLGGHDKSWNIWARNFGRVEPSNEVAEHERYNILAASSKDPESRMLKRSRISREVADALTSSLDKAQDKVPEAGRPAWQPCSEYPEYRRAFHHNLGILASSYAPHVTRRLVEDSNRQAACAFILPLAPSPTGPLFLVPLGGEESIFGVLLDNDSSHKDQTEKACRFISVGIESHHMHGMYNAQRDMVIAVPWDVTPVTHASTREMLSAARASGAPSVWCSLNAIAGTVAHEPASFAAQRCAAMNGPVLEDNLRVGIWNRALPAVLRRAARGYSLKADDEQAESQWIEFIAAEADRKAVMIADLLATDDGSGMLVRICEDVRTAADFASELPVPPQGLPQYHDHSLLFVVAPERPLSLHRDWLHRLPPQALPPGFHKLRYCEHLRQWARRMIAKSKNRNAAFDAFCIEHGHAPPGKSRSKSFTLGRGAAHQIAHADGIGSYNPLDLMLETILDIEGEWLDAVDFTVPENRKWIFDKIKNHIGTSDNQEMMSFLFHGVRWKLEAPRQIRCSKNLQRLDERAQKVVDALRNLEERGYVSIQKISRVDDPLTEEGPIPFIYLPQFECGIGGINKEDGTARIVGDQSDPHDEHRERNKPDGEPDGPVVISFNDLSGPKGAPKEGYAGPLPFPEPEPKPRPRHKYSGLAYLSHYAHLNKSFVVTLDDDMRHMFFQFFIALEDQWLCVWYLVMRIDGVLWLVAICGKTMNMGARNSSKIACNFAQEWLEAWSRKMDDFCEGWIPTQHSDFQHGYATRLAALGRVQARPFWAGVYTDNFDFSFMASQLAATGTLIWKSMNADSNIWLQDHVQYGTCVTFIGGRCVNGAGFGCVVPSKRERALSACRKALAGKLSREDYESNNSFLGHVNDICDWPPGSLQGITGPLKIPGVDTDPTVMTAQASERYSAIIELLKSRPLASFWSGVNDAHNEWSGTGVALRPIVVHATDCCSDPLPFEGNADPKPHIAGFANGLFWRFKLEGEWLSRHITLTEGTGTAAASLMTVPEFPDSINLLGNDATASIAAAVGRAKSSDMQVMQRTLQDEALYQEHVASTWVTHWKGWGNGIPDALSRDNVPMALRIARAFGIKLTELEVNDEVKRFMWRTLVRTRKLAEDGFQVVAKSVDGKSTVLFTSPSASVGSLIESYKVEAFFDEGTIIRAMLSGKNLDDRATMASVGASKDSTFHMLPRVVGGMRDVSDPPSPLLSHRAATPPSGSRDFSLSALSKVPPAAPPTPQAGPRPQHRQEALRAVPSAAEPTPGRHGSPQPTSATAARARATLQVAEVLTSVESEYAICPSDPEKLRAMVGELGQTLVVGIPKGTKSADEWGFGKVKQFSEHMGPTVRWMRPRLDSPLIIIVNEVWFTSLAMFWTAQCNMDPSARRVAAFGATKAQPPSALLAIYGWRRVLRDCGRYLCPMDEVKKVLHGMCLQYKRLHGKHAFEKQQAPLMDNEQLARIERACADSGPTIMVKWTPVQRKMWRFLHNFLICTGTRNDEITVDMLNDFDNIMRENFFPVDADGNEMEATPAAIALMKNGDLLGSMSGSSKRDRLNIHWSTQKQFFEYSDVEVNNLPHAWQQYELAAPCPMEKRALWPAFSIKGGPLPMTVSQSSSQHRALVLHALPELANEVNKPTIHSYRAILASKLAEARARGDDTITDATIQAHVRWKTLASLLSYTKITPARFARNITKALKTDAGKTARLDVPEIEPDRTLRDIEAALGCLEGEEHPESKKPAATPSATPAASKARSKTATVSAVAAPPLKDAPKGKAPANKGKAKAPPPPPASKSIAIIGHKEPFIITGTDSWGLVGSEVSLPHDIWDELDGGVAACTIDHFLGPVKFKRGGTHAAYSVSIRGFEGNYAIKAAVIGRYISSDLRLRLLTQEEIPRAIEAR